jgi:hypothetical protein
LLGLGKPFEPQQAFGGDQFHVVGPIAGRVLFLERGGSGQGRGVVLLAQGHQRGHVRGLRGQRALAKAIG